MKLTKKLEAEILKVYQSVWDANLGGDMETFASLLDDNVSIYGTAAGEIFKSKKEAVKFYKETADQMTGKTEFRKRKIGIKTVGNTVAINEQCDLYVLAESKWIFYGHARITTVFGQKENSWKIVQWHASFPDSRTGEGEQLNTDKVKAENIQLRDAVRRRTEELEDKNRELEIETSLERVRTVAMGMKKRDDMLKICKTISQQLKKLGVKEIRNVQTAIFYPGKGTYMNYEFYAKHNKTFITDVSYKTHRVQQNFAKTMMKGEGASELKQFKGKKLKDWYAYQKTTNQFADKYLLTAHSLNYYWYSLGSVAMGISTYQPLSKEEQELFARFRNVFELAYKRYIDIEKAEEQAREARIQTSLERMRAIAMSMKKPEDLLEVSRVFFKELVALSFSNIRCALIHIFNDEKGYYYDYDYSDFTGGKISHILYTGHKSMEAFLKKVRRSEDAFVEFISKGADLKKWIEFRKKSGQVLDKRINTAKQLNYYFYSVGAGNIGISTFGNIDAEQIEILKRFRNVFHFSYRRYVDIEKAEAQAREGQIQLSLERVRARSMAMQTTEELQDVLSVLFQQYDVLGIHPVNVFLTLFEFDKDQFIYRASGKGGARAFGQQTVNFSASPIWMDVIEKFKKEKSDATELIHYPKESLPGIFEIFHEAFTAVPEDHQIRPEDFPDGIYTTHGHNEFGYLGVNHTRPCTEEEREIIARFAKEFGRVYQRFLDLQKAEEQAREAQIEAALERVRASAMAMHHSGELGEVLSVLFDQFDMLGINPVFAHLSLIDLKNNTFTYRMTGRGGKRVLTKQVVDLNARKEWKDSVEEFKKGKPDTVSCLHFPKETLPQIWKLFNETLGALPTGAKVYQKDFPDGIYNTQGFCKFGYIGFNHNRPPTTEEKEIVVRFANEFGRIYQRYLDIEKAEAQTRESEIQLALERVRARTMAMHQSVELGQVAAVMFEQISMLTSTPDRFNIGTINEKEKTLNIWLTDQQGHEINKQFVAESAKSPVIAEFFKVWKKKSHLIQDLHGDKLEAWVRYMNEEVGIPFKKDQVKEHRYINSIFFSHGFIGITTNEPLKNETIELIERFAGVFQQTYTRFLDLQKAEAQAREAQIQLSLERVRARSMAMHSSEELNEVLSILFQQFDVLGIKPINVWLSLLDEEKGTFTYRSTGTSGSRTFTQQVISFNAMDIWQDVLDQWKSGTVDPVLVTHYPAERLPEVFEVFKETFMAMPEKERINVKDFPNGFFNIQGYCKFGYIGYNHVNPPTEEEKNLVSKFATEFERVYQRFLDIEKAEAQAREAQIEAALEKVRSRSLAMQKADELQEVVTIVGEKLQELGVILDSGGVVICTYFPDSKDVLHWTASFDGSHPSVPYYLPYFDTPIWRETWHSKFETEDEFFEKVYSFEDKNHFFNYAFEHSDYKNLPDEYKKVLLESETHALSFAWQTNSALMIASHNGMLLPEEHKIILKRFAKVFEQAFIRFMDLQKAEKQTRESQIELSLERVRAKAMAMRQSEELTEVLPVIFEQLDGLGVKTVWTHLTLMDMEKNTFTYRMTGREGKRVFAEQVVDMDASEIWQNAVEAFKAEEPDSVVSFYFPPEALPGIWEIFDGIFSTLSEGYKIYPEDFPGGIYTTQANCEFGYIGINSTQKATEEEENILFRFAKEFGRLYRRFLDLQNAEAQARESQIQLSLERVRARSLAMQSSDELHEVLGVLFRQFDDLGIQPVNVFLSLFDREARTLTYRASGKSGKRIPGKQVVEVDSMEALKALYEKWLADNSDTVEVIFYPKEVLPQLFGIFAETFAAMPEEDRMGPDDFPQGGYSMAGYTPFGYLGYDHQRQASEEEKDILSRFCIEFSRVYQRFLDIQKAEKQAREAQIETALERVRARSLAMHHSDEMQSVANAVYDQMLELGIETDAVGMSGVIEAHKDYDVWIGGSPFSDPIRIPFNESTQVQRDYNKVLEQRPELFAKTYSGDIKNEYIHHLLQHGAFAEDLKSKMVESTAFSTSISTAKNSGIQIVRYNDQPYTDQENEILKRFAKVFEQAYIRFMDLQKAEAQARKAQIETALERVRARSMAMHQTDELGDVLCVLLEQFDFLGINPVLTHLTLFDEANERFSLRLTTSPTEKILVEQIIDVHAVESWKASYENWKKGDSNTVDCIDYPPEVLPAVWEVLSEVMSALPEGYKINPEDFPDGLFTTQGHFKFGYLGFNHRRKATEEEKTIVSRFATEFGRVYQRFLDIQKAEAQVKEAQIEAALEKVRSRSLAMHKSEELGEVITVVVEKLKDLGFYVDDGVALITFTPGTKDLTEWMTNPGFAAATNFLLPHFDHPVLNNLWDAKEKGEEFVFKRFNPEESRSFHEHIFASSDFKNIAQEIKDYCLAANNYATSTAIQKNTAIFINDYSGKNLNEDEISILKRFAKVFEQAYIRFLDIKKSEEQARESEIQLGLERVRARAMAMQDSEELKELIGTVFTELTKLDLVLTRCLIMIFDKKTKGSMWWMANSEEPSNPSGYFVKYHDAPPYLTYIQAWKEKQPKWEYILEGNEKAGWDEVLFSQTELSNLPDFVIKGMKAPERICLTASFNQFGCLSLASLEPLKEEHTEILQRFANTFNLTYTRFNDLQQAEAQAREAQIEAALERVRARAMAMHTSEELKEVSLELRKQMGLLGQKNLEVCAIHLYEEDEDFFESWGAMRPPGMEEEIFQGTAKFPKSGIRIIDEMMQLYNSGKKDYVIVNEKEKAVEWFNVLKKHSPPAYEALMKAVKDIPIENLIAYWALSDFSGGSMLMVTHTYPDKDSLYLLRRSANVFDLAYRRFKDLKKAEAQARENEIELSLERVRARTMAMHKSEELQDVVKLVYDQLVELKINVDHAGFVVDYIPKGDWHFWIADKNEIPSKISHPYFTSVWATQFDETKEKGLDYFTTHLNFEEKNKFYKELLSYVPNLPEESKNFYFNCPGLAATTVLNDDVSLYIENFSGTSYSDEENKILMRFGKVFQQTYTRFLDLQKAEVQAREAEIELGLERVRARTMAMQKSDELKEVVQTLSSEIKKLDVIFTRTSIVIYEPATLASTWWLSNPETNESFSLVVKYHELHPYQAHLKAWREKQKAWEYILKGEDKKQWDRFLFNETDLAYLPEQVKQDMQQNESVGLYCSFSNFGYLVLESQESISADQFDVLYRFAKVFDLTYTRFLDIQKAEAQARNSQIEASLERVRAKAMAMHNSEDIAATVDIFFKELKNLDITPIRCGVGQIDEETKTSNVSATTSSNQGDSYEVIGKLRLEGHPVLDEIFTYWKKQEEYYPVLRGEELTNYYKTMNPQVGFPDYPEDAVQYGSYFYFKEGLVFAWTEEKFSEEAIKIFRRFTSVIALTYRRYMDLKEAEAQAREAQIDAALERIRGQAMAMRESNDLLDIVVTMRTEFVKLGYEAGYFWHMRWQPEKYEKAMTSGDGTRIGMVMELPRHMHGDIPLLASWEKSKEPTVVYPMDAEAAIEYVDKMVALGDFKQVDPNAPSHDDIRHIGGITFVMARTMHGEIGYSLVGVVPNPPQEAINTLKRFADVFDLAYRRFEDLQKAEASTRQAIKQAVLDRIRADIASMRTVQDLDRITPLIWNELKTLGVPFIRCGVFLMDDEQQLIHTFLSTPDGKAIAAFHLPYNTPGNISKVISNWKAGENYMDHWGDEEFIQFAEILVQQGTLESGDQYLQTIPRGGFYLHFLPFLQGMLYVGNTEELNEEIIRLLESVADAFSTAYARYEDFNKLEAAKKQVDSTLHDLQEAQKQLIQSEKMASLGELTAGIAHEIQNPLNFVNNFSDVSSELIQEMKDELEKGNAEDALAIAEDVRQNLEKILHHGKRADGIVKGMLQHSRSSSGQKELTDINVLADEYLRLAFHGLRAKDKSFNAKFETHFDENIEKLNIVPQDIGRVILNLINNAFYAVNEKYNAERQMQNAESYEPTVIVSTIKVSPAGEPVPPGREGKGVEKIEISVKDNGNGIPASVKEKIFQPFFTTKPTGQGTGLGLSLSYDIIKAHGGEFKVETREGEGSTFIIQLPIS